MERKPDGVVIDTGVVPTDDPLVFEVGDAVANGAGRDLLPITHLLRRNAPGIPLQE